MIWMASVLAVALAGDERPAGIRVDVPMQKVGLPIVGLPLPIESSKASEGSEGSGSLSKAQAKALMDELTGEYVQEREVEPETFDYNPDLSKTQYLSLLTYPTPNQDIALLDDPRRGTGDMYYVPGVRVEVQGTSHDYERAPVSVVTRDGKTIIANYPRDNVLSSTATPTYPSVEKAFYIDRRPVSKRQYQRFLQDTQHAPPRDWKSKKINDDPVVGITFDDASAYAAWAGKRLPRLSEYERALRSYPALRQSAPAKEWTSTVSNPEKTSEIHYVFGGDPTLSHEASPSLGFRLAMDEF